MKIVNILKRIRSGQLPNVAYMFKRIWEYAGIHSQKSGIPRVLLSVDYIWCALIYGCSCDDYFLYGFYYLKHSGKKQFVLDSDEYRFEKAHTDPAQEAVAADKEKSLAHFAEYIQRDWCGVKYNNTGEDFKAFYERHERGILKPLYGLGGHGIELVTLKEKFASPEAMRAYCLKNNLVAEELIVQHEALNKVYPNAINTLRIVTLKGICIGAALRMGVGNAQVDNASSGGIYAEVDVAEGVAIGQAVNDVYRDTFTVHPTTQTVIPGIKIPFWKECKAFAEKASALLPDVYLIGWDIAVTPAGPTLVEVNTNPGLGLVQAPNGHGLKHEFEKIKD